MAAFLPWLLCVVFVGSISSSTSTLAQAFLQLPANIKCSNRASSLTAVTSSSDDLAFSSFYMDNTGQPRGFCNWIVPQKIMAGRYPHGTPIGSKTGSPSPDEARRHLRAVMTEAGVNTFVMLQTEVPAQDDDMSWPLNNIVPLADPIKANKYPLGFVRYYHDAMEIASNELDKKKAPPSFRHLPIPDFDIPQDMKELKAALYGFCKGILNNGQAIYLHCWGGRGRAGTVGACLYLLLRHEEEENLRNGFDDPMTAANEALDLVQRGYDTRVGEDGGGSKSPETEEQRHFVHAFAQELFSQRDADASPVNRPVVT
jgi:hypothetical protein